MNIPKRNMEKEISTHPGNLLTFIEPTSYNDYEFYGKSQFHHMLRVEKMRAERSKKPLLVMMIDISGLVTDSNSKDIPEKVKSALRPSLREVDIRGWYSHNKTIGVIFTEIATIDANSIEAIIRKIYERFCERLDQELIKKINIFFHVYPKM